MAKRMTDTDKWKKRFIRQLKSEMKLLWVYILDDCNHAGIWEVDIEIASIRLGYDYTKEDLLLHFCDKVIPFDNGDKWFVPDFISFQYGELNPNSNVHKSVISLLDRYNLQGYIKGLERVPYEVIDKAKDKDKDKIYPDELNFEAWDLWKEFRKEQFRTKYKPIGEKAAVKKILNLSNGDKDIQAQIIQQSIENGWRGLFELKAKKQSNVKTLQDNWLEARKMISNG